MSSQFSLRTPKEIFFRRSMFRRLTLAPKLHAGGIAQLYGFMIQNSLKVTSRAKKKMFVFFLSLLYWPRSLQIRLISLREL